MQHRTQTQTVDAGILPAAQDSGLHLTPTCAWSSIAMRARLSMALREALLQHLASSCLNSSSRSHMLVCCWWTNAPH